MQRGADLSRVPVLRALRRWPPTAPEFHGQVLGGKGGRWVAAPLFVVLILVELTDVVFAVDSLPRDFAVTQEPFLVYTSHAFAILGLRAMYFLLADLVHRFVHLKAGPGRDPRLRRRQDAAPRRLEGADLAVAERHRREPGGRRHPEPARHPPGAAGAPHGVGRSADAPRVPATRSTKAPRLTSASRGWRNRAGRTTW